MIALIAVIGVIVYVSSQVGENYTLQLVQPPPAKESQINTHEFAVQNIRVKRGANCGYTEIKKNGEARSVDCFGVASDVDILSNETLANLFGTLDKDDFEQLSSVYYLPGISEDIELYIVTNYGSKTIIISGNNTSAPILDGPLADLVDEIDDIEDDLDDPEPTPVVSIPPTPTLPGFTPTPTPIGGGPTPTPSPTPTLAPGATPEPFSCEMLEQNGVTVSNIRCVDEISP